MATSQNQQENEYEKMLEASVCSVLLESGFDAAKETSLAALTETIRDFINKIGTLSRNYCELAGRSEPLIADVIMAFVEKGFNFNHLIDYTVGITHSVLPSLPTNPPQDHLLQVEESKPNLPSHIPQHFPPFPKPHCYLKTILYNQAEADYIVIREKAAKQKRNTQNALIQYWIRKNPMHNLFDTDASNNFFVIIPKPDVPSYLRALIPQDQVFDDLEFDARSLVHDAAEEVCHNVTGEKSFNN